MRGAARHCVACAIAVKKRFLSTIVRRSASHAVLDALRPLCGAARHCVVSATAVKKRFLSTIVRRSASACRSGRSASYAWRCASLRRLCHRGKKTLSFKYRATLRVACRSGRSASSAWSLRVIRRLRDQLGMRSTQGTFSPLGD
ncbi:hypothetical protein D9N00_10110 [Pseudomonas syringae pv. actinidiae]|nr:hypothetical protein D9N00_10110 [Pseudomonas syringae pv. actinidiae]AYL82369.1 hypothetical protein CN228_22935 [Pseudomonas syringae pv. actinidiae str. Shaanxi_M228]